MSGSPEEQLTFIMTCLKHADRVKPDFDAVGEELGLPSKLCYKRHWGLLQKWGMTSSRSAKAGTAAAANGSNASAPATPKAAAKRGRPKGTPNKKQTKAASKDHENDDGENAADDDDESPSKKAKIEENDSVHTKVEVDADDEEV